jgi:hypothetical protein
VARKSVICPEGENTRKLPYHRYTHSASILARVLSIWRWYERLWCLSPRLPPPNVLDNASELEETCGNYSIVKLAVRQAVFFPVESLAQTSKRYEPPGKLFKSIRRPIGMTGLPALA